MDNLKSKHWMDGGTGLTNFSPEDFPRYMESVARFGGEKFVVSTERMIGRGEDSEGGSLHYRGDIRSEEGKNEVHEFWAVFEQVTEALKLQKAAA